MKRYLMAGVIMGMFVGGMLSLSAEQNVRIFIMINVDMTKKLVQGVPMIARKMGIRNVIHVCVWDACTVINKSWIR